MREGQSNWNKNFLLPLEKYGELAKDKENKNF